MTDLLTIAAVCQMLGISPPTLRDLRRAGKIGYVRLDGRKIRFTAADVADYLDRQHIAPAPQDLLPCPAPSPRKIRRTGTLISSGKVVGFRARQERQTAV